MQQNGTSRRGRRAPEMAGCFWLLFGLCSLAANAQGQAREQDGFHLKAKTAPANGIALALGGGEVAGSASDLVTPAGRIHRIALIDDLPWVEALIAPEDGSDPLPPAVALEGVRHLQFIPPNGVLISAPASFDQDFWGPLYRLEQKVSADLGPGTTHFLAAFHSDVDLDTARGLVLREGGQVAERPDLRPGELLVEGNRNVATALAALDETSWIWPASEDLIRSAPAAGCMGAITSAGPVGEYVATIGQGWDGPGLGAATLGYTFQSLTAKLPSDQARSEFQRALAEWSSHVQVQFQPGASGTSPRNLNVMFGTGSHGDGYPFDGRGRVLAHTFYPSQPNPEPIAGDVHFDDAENWKIGADVDFYSVALHELGHALGLGHSDKPGAVMYAYYRRATSLTGEDIAAIQSLYATRLATVPAAPPASPTAPSAPTPPSTPSPTPPTNPAPPIAPTVPTVDHAPPTLAIVAPAASTITTLATFNVSGTANDNVRLARITWQLRGGIETAAEGTGNWIARDVPLLRGTNYVTIRAYDAAGNSSWRSVSITRR